MLPQQASKISGQKIREHREKQNMNKKQVTLDFKTERNLIDDWWLRKVSNALRCSRLNIAIERLKQKIKVFEICSSISKACKQEILIYGEFITYIRYDNTDSRYLIDITDSRYTG